MTDAFTTGSGNISLDELFETASAAELTAIVSPQGHAVIRGDKADKGKADKGDIEGDKGDIVLYQ